jgi:hypothetical protein
MGYFLTVLVELFIDDKKYSDVIGVIKEQLKIQSPYFIPAWLMNRCRYTNNDDSLRRASAATGNTDLLIRLYDGAICYWANRGRFQETCVMLYELAVIYRRDCQALKMAEDILNRILDTVKHDESFQVDSKLLSMVVSERFDIYFERHNKSWLKTAKESLCKVAGELLDHPRVADVVDSSAKACALITLAKMYNEIGHKYNANECADEAFSICIADLEDWVDDNDMPAFRALAKVLHFGGLSKDAQLAASLVFDRGNAEAPVVTEEEYFNTLSSKISTDNNCTSSSAAAGSSETGGHPSATPGNGVSQVVVLLSESELALQNSQGILQESTGQDGLLERAETTAVTIPYNNIADVDAGNGSVLHCMGPCGKEGLTQWDLNSEHWYFCLDCPNVDYCKDCFKDLKIPGRPQGLGECPMLCWGDHKQLLLPMAGWKGVKGGLIRVDSSSRAMKEWLTDVKERWTSEVARRLRNQKNRKKRA